MDIESQLQRIQSLEKLQANYKTYTNTIREALFAFNSREEPKYHEGIFQNLLERNYYSIKAVDSLFDLYANDQNFKLPICIQIRTALLDSITTVYLAHYTYGDSDIQFKEQVARLNVPLVKEIKRELEQMIESGQIEKGNHTERFELIASYFPDNFITIDTGKIKFNDTISEIKPFEMADEIKKSKHNLGWFGECINTYKRFSQYEHFGSFSKEMLDFQKELEFDHILFASYFTIYGSYLALTIIQDDDTRIERIKSILDNIKPEDLTYQFKTT